jgi:hypothetical protein
MIGIRKMITKARLGITIAPHTSVPLGNSFKN